MARQHYDKLVRDRIPQIIAASGRHYAVTVLADDAFVAALRAKLVEEAQEAAVAEPAELAVELADLLEVVEALAAQHHVTLEQIRQLQVQRRRERGGFAQRLKLLWVE